MINMIKVELGKLFTVRSTYISLGIIAAVIGLITVLTGRSGVAGGAVDPTFFVTSVQIVSGLIASVVAIFAAIIITNEYRYNTISYTLVAGHSRLKVFLSKVFTALLFGLVVSIAMFSLGIIGSALGATIAGGHIKGQELDMLHTLWSQGLYLSLYILIGLSFGYIFRSIVMPIVALFAVPIVEQLLSIAIKDAAKYLPFRTVGAVPNTGVELNIILIACAYVLGFTVLAFVLFKKRDA